MTINRLADMLVLINALVACVAYAAAEGDPLVFMIFTAAAVCGWWLTSVRAARPISKPVAGFFVFAAVAWSAYRVMSGDAQAGLTVSVFCEFLLMILVIKLWDRRVGRDVAQMLTLSVFLSVGAILTSNSLIVGAVLLLNVLTLVVAVTTFHIAAADERAAPPKSPVASAPPRAPVHLWQLGILHALIVLVGLAVSVGVWFTMPRGIGMNQLGRFGEATGGRRVGFTNRVDLRRSGLISESSRQVMEVTFEKASSGDRIGGEGHLFYMRGAVLDKYRNGAWTEDWNEPKSEAKFSATTPRDAWPIPGTPKSQEILQRVIVREAGGRNVPLMGLFEPYKVKPDGDAMLYIGNKTKIITRDGRAGRFSYSIWSGVPRIIGADVPYKHDDVDDPSTPRLKRLATDLLREAHVSLVPDERTPENDIAACRAIERYLRNNCTYTLDPPALTGGGDPIDAFVFETKSGHCEFFASAMASMCRAVGINARVVAGYAVGEYDPEGHRYIVRESNAHAWIEAQVSKDVWRTFDPTPPDTIRRQMTPPTGPLAAINQWLAFLDDVWSASIVSFDETSRANIINRITPDTAERSLRFFESARPMQRLFPKGGWRAFAGWVMVIASVIALWFGIRATAAELTAIISKRWDIRRKRKLQPAVVGAQGRFYARILAALKRQRIEKPAGVPPLRHADALAAESPEVAAHVRDAARLYYKLRFGRTELSDSESRAADQHAAAVESLPRQPRPRVR